MAAKRPRRVTRPVGKRRAKERVSSAAKKARGKRKAAAATSGMVETALAAFAHEVRTPLTGILAISNLLATSDLDERERRWVDTIKAGAEHLASLATLFVDAARSGGPGLSIRQDFFDLRTLARNAGDSLTGRAAAKGARSAEEKAKVRALAEQAAEEARTMGQPSHTSAEVSAEPEQRQRFQAEADAVAKILTDDGMVKFAETYAHGPTRVQFENKDPRGFAEFKRMLAEHSALGSANTQRGVQRERPSLYTLVDEMKKLTVPTLIITGDEDWPCLLPGILMKQNISSSALVVMPNAGHAINLEDPGEYNRIVGDFLSTVESGRWPNRDPRAVSASIMGIKT